MCKGCVGVKCRYYSSFYATTNPDRCIGKFHERCMYNNKAIFDKKSHNCPLENDVILNGGFKDDSIAITAGVSSRDIEFLIDEIYKKCMRDRLVSFIIKRKIGKLSDMMRNWEMFMLNSDFPYTKHKLWTKYQELLKFIHEMEEVDEKRAEISSKYERNGN